MWIKKQKDELNIIRGLINGVILEFIVLVMLYGVYEIVSSLFIR